MDTWFSALVRDVGDVWRSTIRFGAVTESMHDVSDEEELGRYEVEHHAEELVRDALAARKGYAALVAPKRKTPAQVWGWLKYDAYVHVALINVQTTFEGHSLVLNLAREKHTLEHLCVLTLKSLLKSAEAPADVKAMPLVVSAGMAEVLLKDAGEDYAPELVKGYFLAGFTSPGFREKVQPLLKNVHTL